MYILICNILYILCMYIIHSIYTVYICMYTIYIFTDTNCVSFKNEAMFVLQSYYYFTNIIKIIFYG